VAFTEPAFSGILTYRLSGLTEGNELWAPACGQEEHCTRTYLYHFASFEHYEYCRAGSHGNV